MSNDGNNNKNNKNKNIDNAYICMLHQVFPVQKVIFFQYKVIYSSTLLLRVIHLIHDEP